LIILGKQITPPPRNNKIFNKLRDKAKWLGNNYGGFYVYPDMLCRESVIYSFGVGEDISFDLGLIERYNCNVYAFDPTPKSIQWVNNNKPASNFYFCEYGISTKSGYQTFHLPKNKEHVSGSIIGLSSVNPVDTIKVPMKTFKDIVEFFHHKIIDIVKLDIEGAEYEVIPDILNSGVEIKQFVIEFHHRMLAHGAKLTRNTLTLLKENGFELFAYSESMEELSFINMKYYQ
jgi:FkbM family methyltransferase